ncbi:OGDHL, partial [Symbiodinium microadriaticum]
ALDLPIIHVNADDVEAADRAFGLAAEWRADFQRDVVIDLVGYRRFGHNETDRPDVFHPLAYARVREHPEVAKIYAAKLVAEGVLSESEVAEMRTAIWNELDAEFLEKDRHKKDGMDWVLRKYRGRIDEGRRPKQVKGVTGVPLETLHRIGHAMTGIPETVTSHSEVEKLLSKRRAMFAPGGRIDFATAEQLAFCSILLHRDIWAGDAGGTGSWAVAHHERLPNRNVRLAGQDCVRGTFNQRHLIVQDSVRGAGVSLLPQALAPGNQANFYAYNSPLSEAAALAFEYGYSLGDEDALVCWEAQFGDFANCAQAVIDEFIVSGEEKWGQSSRLTLLLPHGYDGQGPNHSSARLERFLQLTNDDPNHLPGNSPEELRDIERAFEILDADGAGILEEGAVKSYMERLPAFQSREFEDEWELWLRVARNMNPEATGITRRDWRMIMQQLYRRNAEKDANIFVLNVTTPAQYFHVLRRQAHRPFMKPLVLMSPKYLLHHAKATSPLEDFGEQSHFMRVIVDYSPFGKEFASRSDNTRHLSTSRSGRPLTEPPEAIRRVILCSGQVYYMLSNARRAKKIKDIVLVRLEQIAPFPYDRIIKALSYYPNADVVWCQEEPKNMGAWSYVSPRLSTCVESDVAFVGRPVSAAPATGSAQIHREDGDLPSAGGNTAHPRRCLCQLSLRGKEPSFSSVQDQN